jgi:hypothetical protein
MRVRMVILLTILVLASCTTNIGVSERNGRTFSEASFRSRTETVTRSIHVIDAPKQLELTYEMEVNSGEIDLLLIDPIGNVIMGWTVRDRCGCTGKPHGDAY